jgi:hypothetical protein
MLWCLVNNIATIVVPNMGWEVEKIKKIASSFIYTRDARNGKSPTPPKSNSTIMRPCS